MRRSDASVDCQPDMLRQRLATAALGIPVIVALVLAGSPVFDAALMAVIAVAVVELSQAAGMGWRRPETLLGAALAAALVPAAYGNRDVQAGMLAAAIMAPLLIAVIRADVTPGPEPQAWLVLAGGTLYAGWLGVHLLALRRLPHGDRWLLLLLLGVFATDSGAYGVGRLLGRHKLAPNVSPAKTVEGAAGGAVSAVAAVTAMRYVFDLPGALPEVLVLGLLLSVAGQVGDLCESALKRRLGVKDMGRLFPGHGGLLDRLDSILFAAPVVYYFVRWLIL
ncbi:MAG: phosphatidate cytidylyltransferase [Dehalococcoidia bacterium]